MEPTPRNVPELGKTVGASALSRGREAALPSAGRGRGSVQTLHNHYLGNAWHEENGVALSDPLCSSPGGGKLKALLELLPPALSLGSGVFFTVFLPWEQPKTLTGWHMLVGEERTEGE